MNNLTLYQCSEDIARALDALGADAADGEACAIDTIEAVIGQFEHKAAAVAAYTLNLDYPIAAMENHIAAVQNNLAALKNKQARIKDYLAHNMKQSGILEIKADDNTFTARFKKNPPKVEITDERMIPAKYIRKKVKVEISVDKTAIKQAIQDGKDVQGAKIVQDERLEIK